MTLELETERLTLRPFELADWRPIHHYLSQFDVVRYLPEEPHTEAQTQRFVFGRVEKSRNNGWPNMLAVVLKPENQVIGHMVFEVFNSKYRTREIGWVFAPEVHGQGYATEAARAVLQLAFGELGLHRVIATCDPRNGASYRVMEKLGMRREAHFVRDVQIRGEWADEYFYAILAEEWVGE